MTDHIKKKAEEFIHIYATAVGSGTTSNSTQHAKAIMDCYVPKDFVAFSHGHTGFLMRNDEGLAQTKQYLERWKEVGVGVDYRLVSYRIEVVSGTSALCFITWTVKPAAGSKIEGWEWENVYFFRLMPGEEKGWWEGVISDNEIGNLMQRFPEFMAQFSQAST